MRSIAFGLFLFLILVPVCSQAQTKRTGDRPKKEVLYPRGIPAKRDHITRQQVTSYLDDRLMEFDQIEDERKAILLELSKYIREKRNKNQPVKLTFICTGNSRRSQLGQIWAATSAAYFNIEDISVFSGGTITTAFNRRIARSLMRSGFMAETVSGNNSDYKVHYSEIRPPLVCFSKKYDDPSNPTSHFAAVMVCADADEHCPVVPGAEFRIAIPYIDPRLSDHSDWEDETYDERNAQIAREMLFVMSNVR
ncbi:MAG: protein-tyrosine-phosphatase [Saprospiraceae bacterium]|nr:protein-tyrosine-phosphatase [Saprospiraceae bacterium]